MSICRSCCSICWTPAANGLISPELLGYKNFAAYAVADETGPSWNAVARELVMERYSIQQILRMLIERSESLKLFVRGNRRDALRHTRWMLGRLARLYSQGETPQLRL